MSKDKIIIFIASRLDLTLLTDFIESHGKDTSDIVIISSYDHVLNGLLRLNITVKSLDDYRTIAETHLSALKESLCLVNELGNVYVNKQETIKQFLVYREISLWNVMDIELMAFLFADKVDKINVLIRLFDKESPGQIVCFTTYSDWFLPLGAVAKNRNVPIKLFESGLRARFYNFLNKHMIKKDILHLLNKFLPIKNKISGMNQLFVWIPQSIFFSGKRMERFYKRLQSRRRLRGLSKSKDAVYRNKGQILFVAVIKRYLASFMPVIRQIQEHQKNSCMVIDLEMIDAYKILESEDIPYRLLQEYYVKSVMRKIKSGGLVFKKKWETLKNSSSFKKAFSHKDIDLWDICFDEFKEMYFFNLLYLIDIIELTEELIRQDSPIFLVTSDERKSTVRAMVETCRLHGIKSLNLLSHSIPEDSSPWQILATDFMAVEGEATKKVLLSNGIAEDRLFVTGQPRFDFLINKDRIFERRSIYKKLNIDPSKKIGALTTNPIVINVNRNEKLILLQEVYKVFKDLDGYHIVVKLHPSDSDGRLENEVAKEIGLRNISIVNDSVVGIWELFYVSDLVITTVSTTAMEAIAMDRLLIQVKLNQIEPDWMPCARNGAALGVEKPELIRPTIVEALGNLEAIRKRLSPYRDKFLEDRFYRIDGMASQRVADLINSFTNQEGLDEKTSRP